jgi:hypothetical protein
MCWTGFSSCRGFVFMTPEERTRRFAGCARRSRRRGIIGCGLDPPAGCRTISAGDRRVTQLVRGQIRPHRSEQGMSDADPAHAVVSCAGAARAPSVRLVSQGLTGMPL